MKICLLSIYKKHLAWPALYGKWRLQDTAMDPDRARLSRHADQEKQTIHSHNSDSDGEPYLDKM